MLDVEPASTGTGTDVPDGDVVVDDVTVTYPGADVVALAPTSLVVPRGRVVAVVGPSGVGKSTLLAALQGFVAPTSGAITVGGTDITTLAPGTWRTRVAVVSQDPVLLGPTVADDVRMRRPRRVRRRGRRRAAVRGHRPALAPRRGGHPGRRPRLRRLRRAAPPRGAGRA